MHGRYQLDKNYFLVGGDSKLGLVQLLSNLCIGDTFLSETLHFSAG